MPPYCCIEIDSLVSKTSPRHRRQENPGMRSFFPWCSGVADGTPRRNALFFITSFRVGFLPCLPMLPPLLSCSRLSCRHLLHLSSFWHTARWFLRRHMIGLSACLVVSVFPLPPPPLIVAFSPDSFTLFFFSSLGVVSPIIPFFEGRVIRLTFSSPPRFIPFRRTLTGPPF